MSWHRGVLALGHNSRRSFGAHAYLIVRPEGNLMTDSPRFQESLANEVDRLGGVAHVLLGHRDDVADAHRWASRYDARVWIHKADADAAPYATDIIDQASVAVSTGVTAIHAPGHTKGHLVFHVDENWLFTGDTLHWNPRLQTLDVTPKQTWDSWDVLADSIEQLSRLSVEGVFPTHGMWCQIDAQRYSTEMSELAVAMRDRGQEAWAQREGTTFGWY